MIKKYTHKDLLELEKFFRINLINSISGYKSANLIGTKSEVGVSNVAIFSSVTHLGSSPPLLGFVCRPTPENRQTYSNLKASGFYTINHVTKEIHVRAHQTSARYAADVSEFDTCDLTEEFIDNFAAPFVKESSIKMGLSFVEEHYIKANDTLLIVGKVEKLILPEALIEASGHLDIHAAETVTIGGLDTYFETKELGRYAYAKPDLPIRKLS